MRYMPTSKTNSRQTRPLSNLTITRCRPRTASSRPPQYGSYKSWLDFQKEILKFAQQRDYIIVTDIANYYDFINYTHLRNIIAGTINVRESILDFLIFVLSSLL